MKQINVIWNLYPDYAELDIHELSIFARIKMALGIIKGNKIRTWGKVKYNYLVV